MYGPHRRSGVAVVVAPAIAQAKAVAEALEEEGWEARLFIFHAGVTRPANRLIARLFRVSGVDPRRAYNNLLRTQVLPAVMGDSPDLFLVVKGHDLDRDTFHQLCRLDCPIAIWTIDSLKRFPGQQSIRPLASHGFYMDGGDVTDPDSSWLPLGHDENLLGEVKVTKDIDVLFVGFLKSPHYNTRRRFLNLLAESRIPRKYHCLFVGTTGTRMEDVRLQHALPFPVTGRVSMQEYARLIARARVCINIHQDDGFQPVNPTFFLIPGVGTCQLTDRRPYLAHWLRPGQEYLEVTEEDLEDTIDRCLRAGDEWRRIGEEGCRTVASNHTYRIRVRKIIDVLSQRD